jgi:ankyrin repeat protein
MNRVLITLLFLLAMGCGCIPRRHPPIGEAAKQSDLQAVRRCVEAGDDVNEHGLFGMTALHWAAGNNRSDIVTYLLEHGADIESRDKEQSTPLLSAAAGKALDVVRLLANRGAKTDVRDKDNCGVIHFAGVLGPLQNLQSVTNTLDYLLCLGLDINERDYRGWTILDWAEVRGGTENARLAAYIISHGGRRGAEIDPSLTNKLASALHPAPTPSPSRER